MSRKCNKCGTPIEVVAATVELDGEDAVSLSVRPDLRAALQERIAGLSDAQLSELGNTLAAYALRAGRSEKAFAAECEALTADKRAALLELLAPEQE